MRITKRRLGMAAGLLAIAAALTGCGVDGEFRETEARLDELPGVTGSYMWDSFDGSPTNRGLSARVYVEDDPGADLSELIDAGLETAWSFTGFRPDAGVNLEVVVGPRPAAPEAANADGQVDLEGAVDEIGLGVDVIGVLPSFGGQVQVPAQVMVERYGEWPGGEK